MAILHPPVGINLRTALSYSVSASNLNIRVAVARAAIVQQQTPGIMTHKDIVDAWGKGPVSVGVDQIG
jgi:hypothetical protein